MDVCENVTPVSDDLSNEMPVEVSNEMPVDLDIEMPVNVLPEENVEDRHVVNGESYASRAARTVSHEYPPRSYAAAANPAPQTAHDQPPALPVNNADNELPSRPCTAFLNPRVRLTHSEFF